MKYPKIDPQFYKLGVESGLSEEEIHKDWEDYVKDLDKFHKDIDESNGDPEPVTHETHESLTMDIKTLLN